MFLKVEDIVINTDRITAINIKKDHELKIFFSDEHYRSIFFTSDEKREAVLNALGITATFEK